MRSMSLKDALCRALREKSGLERHRPYLGMSQISQCPRVLYFNFMGGLPPATDQQHWYCWTGYLHEGAVAGLLVDERELQPRQMEVVAGFDARFRGHVDCLIGECVVEIKSVGWQKFVKLRYDARPQREHIYQVQMYLRHGGWKDGLIAYVARDVPHKEFDGPPFWVFEVTPDEALADRLDQKARDVLAAIDRRETPACICGWCKR